MRRCADRISFTWSARSARRRERGVSAMTRLSAKPRGFISLAQRSVGSVSQRRAAFLRPACVAVGRKPQLPKVNLPEHLRLYNLAQEHSFGEPIRVILQLHFCSHLRAGVTPQQVSLGR